ncbi:MAG: NAD-dependent epimerase/dehydratase family protein [Acidobacteriota bacterium]|nr:NAD-dependent epimerase/dehydratase family protein [Acidobacteriota bacterium]
MPRVLILGCGYTGQRLARSLLKKGVPVIATTRNPARLASLAQAGVNVVRLDLALDPVSLANLKGLTGDGTLVLHSIPPISIGSGIEEPTPRLIEALHERCARLVYLSTTGVYGATRDVDERTLPAPRTEREELRVAAEQAVVAGSISSLILRPAAIYGPGRGVHVSLQGGTFRLWGKGDNFVSRIHVDDLAAHVEAALFSDVKGAFPVADDEPCPSREIAGFCARLLGLEMPPEDLGAELGETRHADRRVDGSAIRRALGIALRYPSYRAGIPASL